jgi:hypothetical protein
MAKERVVGEIFEYRWAKIKCVLAEGTGACNECHFVDDGCLGTACMPCQRADRQDVIFIRIKKGDKDGKI